VTYRCAKTTLAPDREQLVRQLATTPADDNPYARAELLRQALAETLGEIDALRERLAARDVCEACGDVLMPASPRCERHVHTLPGDPEWTDWQEPPTVMARVE
jgi:hypothetical protein